MAQTRIIIGKALKIFGFLFGAWALLAFGITLFVMFKSDTADILFPGLGFTVIFGFPAYILLFASFIVKRWSEVRVRYIALAFMVGIPVLAFLALVILGVIYGSHRPAA